jgi:hypothetical protein
MLSDPPLSRLSRSLYVIAAFSLDDNFSNSASNDCKSMFNP